MSGRYRDRREAGRLLGRLLRERFGMREAQDPPPEGLVVLALPRGGVPVAAEVARALRAPLDVFVVRKLGAPGHEELAMGALASGGVRLLNAEVVELLGVGPDRIEAVAARESRELARREAAYRGGRPPLDLAGRPVVLVDDGIATGFSVRAALEALRRLGPASVTLAAPVGPPSTVLDLRRLADEVVVPLLPPFFHAVGAHYEDFGQTSDEEVVETLLEAAESRNGATSKAHHEGH